MDFFYVGILAFLIILATFDLSVGVANDAVNFLSPAVGAKTAKFRTILLVAAIGIFVGASTSSGMMDIARHGILNPLYYTFDDVMCIFLAVAATDVILLDIFNTLGMPTSTTVSMVFGLLGGSTALAFSKMVSAGMPYAELINTDKALSVIIGIFLSVAIAFVVGLIVMWLTRVVFTFEYKKHLRYSVAIFGGIGVTSIFYFLITSGLRSSNVLHNIGWTPEWIDAHKVAILRLGELHLNTSLRTLILPGLQPTPQRYTCRQLHRLRARRRKPTARKTMVPHRRRRHHDRRNLHVQEGSQSGRDHREPLTPG